MADLRRIALIIEYDGTNYVGWQVQPNGVSVQQVITEAFQKQLSESPILHASGRTDSGVHAAAQVAHFDTTGRIPADKYCYALNTRLPSDIRIKASIDVPLNFHARFSVKEKRYRYAINNSPHASVFTRSTALHRHYHLDIDRLNKAASFFIGEHDFNAFRSAGSKTQGTVRTIYRSEWERRGSYLFYNVAGSGFLYNMVRIMVGTMIRIGSGYDAPETVLSALENPIRCHAGDTAPAHGLTLYGVKYDLFDTNTFTTLF